MKKLSKPKKKVEKDKSLKAFLKDCKDNLPTSVLKEDLFFLEVDEMCLNFN